MQRQLPTSCQSTQSTRSGSKRVHLSLVQLDLMFPPHCKQKQNLSIISLYYIYVFFLTFFPGQRGYPRQEKIERVAADKVGIWFSFCSC